MIIEGEIVCCFIFYFKIKINKFQNIKWKLLEDFFVYRENKHSLQNSLKNFVVFKK